MVWRMRFVRRPAHVGPKLAVCAALLRAQAPDRLADARQVHMQQGADDGAYQGLQNGEGVEGHDITAIDS
jgi:hypothetical protein